MNTRGRYIVDEARKTPSPLPASTELENDEFWPLSGKPYFHLVLSKSHVKPSYHMTFPSKLRPVLPGGIVPAVVKYGNKSWNTTFYGNGRQQKFDLSWKSFVIDNSLNVGDALVFELSGSSKQCLKFRVQILRGDFPSELLERVNGMTSKDPIVLD